MIDYCRNLVSSASRSGERKPSRVCENAALEEGVVEEGVLEEGVVEEGVLEEGVVEDGGAA